MPVYSVRLNDRLSDMINRNANEQGITSRSVYIRSLVEKGLVVDSYIHDGKADTHRAKQWSLLEIRLAQIVVENLALSREILKMAMKSEDAFKAKVAAFKQNSQDFVMDLLKTEGH